MKFEYVRLVGPYDIYNDQVDMKLQYLIENNINPCSWLEVEYEEIGTESLTIRL